ncbi:transglutaminase family protein [Oryzibacter oryziterrae]|uniref:transglutaminase family protein n=1 Tax=Oryzibacter oryziterrae TaxID=2766474 RepID=UPI001F4820FB|nr:transglutaminase family protein [Oryzibacter oryziterrae]
MRLRIHHEIKTEFDEPASMVVRSLRMSPRNFDGQYVRHWRIDVDSDCRQDRTSDPFGNVVHDFAVPGPLPGIVIVADGEVEVDDMAGVLKGIGVDRMPIGIYLRDTPLTEITPPIRALAADVRATSDGSTLDVCHRLMERLHEAVAEVPAELDELTGVATGRPEDTLTAEEGSPVAQAHAFIAAARSLALPARFISGYRLRDGGTNSLHAWAEALIDGLGWVAFDVTANKCPTDSYVRIASGLDQAGAAWVRGYDRGSSSAVSSVKCVVEQVGY